MFPFPVTVLFRGTVARSRAHRALFLFAVALLTELLLSGLLGGDGNAQDLELGAHPPTLRHVFGTDVLGRDLLLRVLEGGRTSLEVVGGASLVSIVVGVPLGMLVAHIQGQRQRIFGRLLELAGALPYLMLVILLMLMVRTLRAGVGELGMPSLLLRPAVSLVLSLGLGQSLVVARIVQEEVEALLATDFYLQVRLQGAGAARAAIGTLLPNCAAIVATYVVLGIPGLLFAEAFLSFLGFGLESPQLSWGTLISEGRRSMAVYPWLLAFPAVFLSALCFVIHMLGEAMREQHIRSTKGLVEEPAARVR